MPQDTILQKTIIEELGMQNIPQEQQEELLAKMGDVLFKKVLLETLEVLDEEDQKIKGTVLTIIRMTNWDSPNFSTPKIIKGSRMALL